MTREIIYFSRHGETDWNVSQRVQGQMDIDINDNGRTQADRNGDLLRSLLGTADGYDFVASPLSRTRETMERIRTRMGLDPKAYRMDPLLMEVHFGDWQGHMLSEFETAEHGVIARREQDKWNFVPPGELAESYQVLSERIKKWMGTVQQKTVCVTHGGCIRTLFYSYGGMSGHDAANLLIPQDKILKLENGQLSWH